MSREKSCYDTELFNYKCNTNKFHNQHKRWSDDCQQLPGSNASPIAKQTQVDLESILQNRNINRGRYPCVNPVNVAQLKQQPQIYRGNMGLNECSRLSHPAMMYRSMATQRFHPLPRDPQVVIFWNFEKNTHLECIDNYAPKFN